jgi:C-terminal processing protease CtpA/Prc
MLNIAKTPDNAPERGWWLNDPGSDRKAFGMVLHLLDGHWTVARTPIGSPAANAGVAVGERFTSVDDYEIGKDDMHELHLLLELDNASSHLLTFRVDAGDVKREIAKQPLRDLLEHEGRRASKTRHKLSIMRH